MFRDHPNVGEILVIVDPDLRENLRGPCDIPKTLAKSMGEFEFLFGENFDSSLLNLENPIDQDDYPEGVDLWFLENTDDEL